MVETRDAEEALVVAHALHSELSRPRIALATNE
jgi:hypothetical protein